MDRKDEDRATRNIASAADNGAKTGAVGPAEEHDELSDKALDGVVGGMQVQSGSTHSLFKPQPKTMIIDTPPMPKKGL